MQVMWNRRLDDLEHWWGVTRREKAELVSQLPWQLDGHNAAVAREGRVAAEDRSHDLESALPYY